MEWANATHVRCKKPIGDVVLYETSNRDEIAALVAALRVEPAIGRYCMCIGTLVFDLDGKYVTLHHGESLRWKDSNGNADLVDPDAIMDWLSARGITFVREQYEAAKIEGERSRIEGERWRAMMPSSLQPFFDDMRMTGLGSNPAWTAALEAQFPDPVVRAREMITLFGSGSGRYSGFPSWEGVPLTFVMDMPLDVLVAAIGDAPHDRLCAGAVRLVCSWNFRERRAKLLAKLSPSVHQMLHAHAQTMPDEERERAVRALIA